MTITALPDAPSRLSPSDFSTKADAFIAALATFVTEANALAVAMNLNATTANSTTELTIGTGAQNLTVDTGKSYQPGMSVKIARTSSPSNWMHGDVTSYNAGTGALVVNVLDVLGSGTYTDWTITFSAPNLPFASAAQIVAGTPAGLVIAPDQLALAMATYTSATRPAFLAYKSSPTLNTTGDGTYRTVVCDTEIFDQAANYDNSTGIFTAPVTGKYPLGAMAYIYGLIAAHNDQIIKIVTSNRGYVAEMAFAAGANPFVSRSFQIFVPDADMDAGDTAYFQVMASGDAGNQVVDIYGGATGTNTFFGGGLLI